MITPIQKVNYSHGVKFNPRRSFVFSFFTKQNNTQTQKHAHSARTKADPLQESAALSPIETFFRVFALNRLAHVPEQSEFNHSGL